MPTTSNFGWTTPADTDLVKDGAAAIRTLGNGIDSSLVDLKGGTTGQILAKASNTDLDFSWIANDQGDITAVTAGTGISGGGTTGAVTITNDMATTITAAGDIVVGTGNATYDNLPIGTTGQVLTADTSVSPYKVKWADPGGTLSWSLLNSGGTSLSGAASVTISFSAQKRLFIIYSSTRSATALSEFRLRPNNVSTADYSHGGFNLRMNSNATTMRDESYGTVSQSTETGIYCGIQGNGQSRSDGSVVIEAADTTGWKPFRSTWGFFNQGTVEQCSDGTIDGLFESTSAITSITFVSSVGNFNAGTMYVYGGV